MKTKFFNVKTVILCLFSQVIFSNAFSQVWVGIDFATPTIRTGAVGIGMSSLPNTKLQVYSGTTNTHLTVSGRGPSIRFNDYYTTTSLSGESGSIGLASELNAFLTNSIVSDLIIKTTTNTGSILFGTGATATEKMRISSNGSVGIGTGNNPPSCTLSVNGNVKIGDQSIATPAGYKLYVSDGILTEKLKVAIKSSTTDWSDYVFDKSYKLRSLGEVEKFITENKHLPGIPSAEEVVKSGIDVAKMDAKLLEKIEELTLYVIQQQKQIDELKSQMGK